MKEEGGGEEDDPITRSGFELSRCKGKEEGKEKGKEPLQKGLGRFCFSFPSFFLLLLYMLDDYRWMRVSIGR